MEKIDSELLGKPSTQTLLALSMSLDELRDKLTSSISSRMNKIEKMVHGQEIKREHIDSLMSKGVSSTIRKY